MKSWKEVPHLFANGKFKVKIEWLDGMIEAVPLYVNSKGQAIADFKKNSGGEIRKFPYEFVSLIARKIEDMTDEEWAIVTEYDGLKDQHHRHVVQIVIMRCEDGLLRRNTFLYLLSIGVYPFDQKAFETGEVLDIKSIQQPKDLNHR